MSNEQEVWKQTKYPKWEVSNQGRVRRTKTQQILSGWILGKRYPRRCVGRHVYVSHLVCEAFNGPKPTPEHEVDHKDGDTSNDYYENLEWVTHAENMRRATESGRMWAGSQKRQFPPNPATKENGNWTPRNLWKLAAARKKRAKRELEKKKGNWNPRSHAQGNWTPRDCRGWKRVSGEKHWFSKLSDTERKEIKQLYGSVPTKQLAKKFHVSYNTIWNIGRREAIELLKKKGLVYGSNKSGNTAGTSSRFLGQEIRKSLG